MTRPSIKRLLAGRRPDLRDVARELGVSTRTLQRRLGDAGVTFQQLLEDARRELARHYLLHSSLDLIETAYLLGYEDANSFFRAFQQWEAILARALARGTSHLARRRCRRIGDGLLLWRALVVIPAPLT